MYRDLPQTVVSQKSQVLESNLRLWVSFKRNLLNTRLIFHALSLFCLSIIRAYVEVTPTLHNYRIQGNNCLAARIQKYEDFFWKAMYATSKPLGQLKLQDLLLERSQCHSISKNKLGKKGLMKVSHTSTKELPTEHCKNRREESSGMPQNSAPNLILFQSLMT